MTEPDQVFKKLTFKDDKFVYLLPCVEVTLYWAGSHTENAEGIIEFYNRSLEQIGNGITFYRTEAMSAARRLKKDSLDLIPLWFKGTTTKRDVYMLFLETGVTADEPSDRAFALDAVPGIGSIRLVLPVRVADEPERLLELALSLAKALPFDFGQAGYSINWNHLGRYEREALDAMNGLTRYPGLDLAHPFSTKFVVTKGIKCVNWLTFLGAAYCQKLGGESKLRKSFTDDIVVHKLKHGVAIQAGPRPELGDVNRKAKLPLYQQVGKIVAPVRARPHPPIFGPEGFADREVTEKWLSRFD